MTYIPATLRQQVITRANYHCEYCLIHQEESLSMRVSTRVNAC